MLLHQIGGGKKTVMKGNKEMNSEMKWGRVWSGPQYSTKAAF